MQRHKSTKMKRIVTILTFICAFCLNHKAQEVHFRQFSTAEGLPNSMVRQVTQDAQGYIWMATFYGLYRYDGYEIRPYKSDMQHPNLLPSNNVVCLASDSVHMKLWIGTHEGICCLNLLDYQVRKYHIDNVNKRRINDICITKDGQVYAATIRGLARYDENLDSMILLTGNTFKGDIPGKINMQGVCETPDGDILIATWEKGIYRYVPQQRHFFHYPEFEGMNGFLSVYKDNKDHLWAGSNGAGAMKLEFSLDKKNVSFHRPNSIPDTGHVYAFQEHNGVLWTATRNGLKGMNTNLPAVEVRDVFKDADGRLWVSTKGAGIYIADFRKRQFDNQLSTSGHNQLANLVSALYVESDGSVWAGQGYGVRYIHEGSIKNLIPDQRPYHINQGKLNKHIYIAVHDGGLLECAEGKILHRFLPNNCHFIPHKLVRMALEDIRGNLWVATYWGLGVRYADGREIRINDYIKNVPSLNQEITSIIEDNDGTLWVASENKGIVHLYGNMKKPDEIHYTIYNKEGNNLPINTPLCIKLDRSGRLWVGTEGCGLCLYDKQTDQFISIHQQNNLPGDMVNSIEEDKFGNLWLGTNLGLARFTLDDNKLNRVRVYTTSDGLADNFFEQNAVCQQGDYLYFGCGSGYVSVLAQDTIPNANSHCPTITRILKNGKETDLIPYMNLLTIEPSIDDFTLCFSALCYTDAAHCSYAYRMVGYDRDWHYTSASNRRATYTNLPPGTYTFELKATNEEGVWSPIVALAVEVEPPFWRTWWAYIIYIIIGVAIVAWAVHRIRQHMMLRNKLMLQMNDGELQLVIDHEQNQTKTLEDKKQLAFEIKDLNYTDADERFLKDAIQCVNNHLSDADFDIPQFVEELATSRTTMFKKLKSLTGMSATAFIRDIRLKAACQALDQNPNIRISELAYQVGFNDPKYFSVCFKKEFGLSPSEYVERQ